MLHIAIVEDEEKERAHLKDCLNYLAEKEKVIFQVTEFPSGRAFLGDYKPVYDIVLMDIEMPGMDGMETARALRKMDTATILIFVTNMVQYAINGYEVDAMNYILKPVSKFDFAMKMGRAISRSTKRMDESIQVKTAKETYKVRLASIKYLEVSGHYVIYHTTDGDFSEYITLKEAEKKVSMDYLVRCHRCFLVNLGYISSVKGDMVYVGNEELPISRPQKKDFLNALAAFIGGVR